MAKPPLNASENKTHWVRHLFTRCLFTMVRSWGCRRINLHITFECMFYKRQTCSLTITHTIAITLWTNVHTVTSCIINKRITSVLLGFDWDSLQPCTCRPKSARENLLYTCDIVLLADSEIQWHLEVTERGQTHPTTHVTLRIRLPVYPWESGGTMCSTLLPWPPVH